MISGTDIFTIPDPISQFLFQLAPLLMSLLMPMRERSSSGPFWRSATIAISDIAAFGNTALAQPRLIPFGIHEICVKVDFFPSIPLCSRSPYDLWIPGSQRLEKGSISEFLAFNIQYFILRNYFAKFECILWSVNRAHTPHEISSQNYVTQNQYEVLHFACQKLKRSLSVVEPSENGSEETPRQRWTVWLEDADCRRTVRTWLGLLQTRSREADNSFVINC